MSYTFHLCRLKKCPNVMGWWQEVQPQEHHKVNMLHTGVAASLFMKSGVDPHNDIRYSDKTDAIDERDFLNVIRHPIILGGKYLATLTDQTLFRRKTLLVNSAGGWCYKDDTWEILETRELPTMAYPTDIDPKHNFVPTEESDLYKETIRITQWPDGTHFYLRSNKNRLFFPEKFDTYEQAFEEAKKYVAENRIVNAGKIRTSEFSKLRPRDGD